MQLIIRFTLLCTCTALFNSFVYSQGSVRGYIKNADSDMPVDGAVVSIEGAAQSVLSDSSGSFIIEKVEANEIRLSVSHVAFKPQVVTVSRGSEITIKLLRRPVIIDEAVISATRIDNRSAFAYSNLDKEAIEKNNLGRDLPFLLNTLPSVVVTSDAGTGIGYTGIRIRGSDATRVNVTINGIPVNDAESHQVYWVDLPDLASSVEDIQVQRGVGSSVNGAGAFGGSVNIKTKKASSNPFSVISSSAGSFNTFKNTVQFGSGIISDVFSLEGRLSKITSDGYVERASGDLRSFYLSGRVYGRKNHLHAVMLSGKEKTYQAWYGLPSDSLQSNRRYNPAGEYVDEQGNIRYYENQTDNYHQDYYQLHYTHEIGKNMTASMALHYTYGRGYYEEYWQNELLAGYNIQPPVIGDSTITHADLVRQLWLSNHFYGWSGAVDFKKNRWDVKAGITLSRFEGKHFGEVIAAEVLPLTIYPFRYYKNDAEKSEASAFIRSNYSLTESTILFLDLQQRMIEYSFFGFNDDYLKSMQEVRMNFFNPKAGISVRVSDKTLAYASVAVGHKEPVRDDFIYSSPANRPKEERMIDYEAGLRFVTGKFSAEANAFFMDYKNQLILTGRINDVGEYIRENVSDSYRAGVELHAKYEISSRLNISGNVSLSRNRIKNYLEYTDDYDGGPQITSKYENTSISFSPEVTGASVITYMPLKFAGITLTGKYVGRQFLDNTSNNNRKLDEYFVSDLQLFFTTNTKKIKQLDFRIQLYNILNAEYVSNGYTYSGFIAGERNDYKYYYPQAKFNWLAGVTLKF